MQINSQIINALHFRLQTLREVHVYFPKVSPKNGKKNTVIHELAVTKLTKFCTRHFIRMMVFSCKRRYAYVGHKNII